MNPTQPNPIQCDDWIHDPLDGRWRRVAHVEGTTVHMVDGGFMGLDECTVIALSSENLGDRHYDRTFKSQRDASYSAWSGDLIRRDASGLFGFIPPSDDRQMLDGDVLVV